MKRRALHLRDMVFLALVALASLAVAQLSLHETRAPFYDLKLQAARNTARAFALLKQRFLDRGFEIDPVNDPAQTGLIGLENSPITTSSGNLTAKLTSINPNFAALILQFLKEAGVRPGDAVAVGMTGSFPALNVATLMAIQALGARPLVITSVGSSSWGANRPTWTWLDMEHELFAAGLIPGVSLAASYGGADDVGRGLSPEGRALLDSAITRNDIPKIHVLPLERSIELRMQRFREAAGHRSIRAYVNIGGGVASLGTSEAGYLLNPGLNRPEERVFLRDLPVRGVVYRFLEQGVPVVHLLEIVRLARRYGLPVAPAVTPDPGTGPLFWEQRYHLGVILALLVLNAVLLLLLPYYDLVGRLLGRPEEPPEETV